MCNNKMYLNSDKVTTAAAAAAVHTRDKMTLCFPVRSILPAVPTALTKDQGARDNNQGNRCVVIFCDTQQ